MSKDNEYDRLCATKKGRERLVKAVQDLAAKHGATAELHEFNGPREIGLELISGPYQCMMHFDGAEKIGAFLGHWHTSLDSDATYPDAFWRVGSLNELHKQKATTICYTLANFLQKLEEGLTLLKRTTAMNWQPITEDEYDAALGALPPRVHLHNAFLLGEQHSCKTCSVTSKVADTFRPYAQIGGAFYKGDPVTVAEFTMARAKGFSI